ncbi:helix-turn-helix domain-containing protein [Gracilibacillus saliphilus]|uniref:helix-turn-helix domain-containing protein n=1 Tax=Gracilibacillus saliphilus TaxID=543890 RepID=UPI003B5225ED
MLKRKRKKITHQMLAEVLDCTQAHISLYENRKTNMSVEKERLYQNYILNY